jgi:hypothetical protein
MEILIVGVLVVALMVYVSTKIKKSAASAFEPEIIDNEIFRIVKPEGFINPINEDSKFAFEAYTKEFGKNDADELRQATAGVMAISDSTFEAVIENTRKASIKFTSEKLSDNPLQEQRICLLESEKIEKGIAVKTFHKIIESIKHRKIYHLQISVLDAYEETYANRTNEMLESFVVK